MRPFLLALVSCFVLACPQPPEMQCDRSQVAADGTVGFNGGFGGGFAGGVAGGFGGGVGAGFGGGTGAATPLHLEGEAISMRVVAPLTSCPSDDLRLTVEVLAPDSSSVPNVSTPVRASNTVVDSTVTFTPTAPGLYVVHAVFEPSLGVRTFTVTVIGNYVESSGVRVSLPAGVTCSKAPWPVSSDTIACESPNAQVSLISADGSVETFDGAALVAVGDVLWSETSTHTLERRTWSVDAGFTLTRSIAGWSSLSLRGVHTRTTAVRIRNNNLVGLALADGGLTESFFDVSGFESGLYFAEPDGVTRLGASFPCGNCLQSLVGFDDGFAWQQFAGSEQLNGYKRPITDETAFFAPNQMLQLFARTTLPPREPLERWPLWLDPGDRPGISILIRPRGGTLDWSAWPRGRVVRVGASAAVLNDGSDAGSVFFVAPLER